LNASLLPFVSHDHNSRRKAFTDCEKGRAFYAALSSANLVLMKIRVGSANAGIKQMTAMAKPLEAEALEGASSVRKHYLQPLNVVERLHRQFLDVIKDELDRRDERETNSVQALLLFNVGYQEFTAGELRTRGYYLASNVSYNLKKLVEAGYIHHQRSEADRRSVLVRLTKKGEVVRDMLR